MTWNCSKFITIFAPCTKCGKSFTRKESLLRHNKVSHDLKPADFLCNICSNRFAKNSQRREHLKIAHPDGMFQCSQGSCTSKFRKSISYHKHLTLCRSSNPKFKCKVPECNKLFNNKSLLEQHKYKHEEPRLMCHHCGKKFRWLSSYRSHLRAIEKKESIKTEKRVTNYEKKEGIPDANATGSQLVVNIVPKSQQQIEYPPFVQTFETLSHSEQVSGPNILPDGNFWSSPVGMQMMTQGSNLVTNQGVSMEISETSRESLSQYIPSFDANALR